MPGVKEVNKPQGSMSQLGGMFDTGMKAYSAYNQFNKPDPNDPKATTEPPNEPVPINLNPPGISNGLNPKSTPGAVDRAIAMRQPDGSGNYGRY